MSLTPKQAELLLYIDGYIKQAGACPSYEDMADALKLASKSGVNRLINGLVERGYVRRIPHRARAIEVLRLPGGGDLATYRAALEQIATGEGAYGAQAHEYKQIARRALGMPT